MENPSNEAMKTDNEKIKIPMLIPLGLAILVLLGVSITGICWLQQQHINKNTKAHLEAVRQFFPEHLKEDSRLLNAIIDFVKNDKNLQSAWLAKDRNALLGYSSPIFKDIHDKYSVTHFYFHDLNKTCFLRVHDPARYGDNIDRFTLGNAAREQKNVYGIELGPYGIFTLRCVQPWYIEGKLAGFLELGKETTHITSELKETLDVELFLLINKSYLNRTDWEHGLKVMSRQGNWDLLPDFVVIDHTIKQIPSKFLLVVARACAKCEGKLFAIPAKNRTYHAGFVPLLDAGGREVGRIVVMKDVTESKTALYRLLTVLIAVSIPIAVSLLSIFYLYIRRIENRLTTSYSLLRVEIENRKCAEEKLQQAHAELEIRVKERTAELEQSYALQKTLNNLLSISLQDIPKETMLEQFINEIIAVPVLEVKPAGAIFLVEDQPGILVMRAQRGLAKPLLTICSKVPFGQCLCGRAAASGKMEFADCVDERHENRFDKISPHGHYCIPIISPAKKVLGVLNLYTKAGLAHNKKTEDFLFAVSNVLTSTIERKDAEEKLLFLNTELEQTVKNLIISNRNLQDLIHVAAHDLKAPLRAIGTLADWLATDYNDKLDQHARKQINLLTSRVTRMSNHIDGILHYSTISLNPGKKERINLNTLIDEVIGGLTVPENIDITTDTELPTVFCEKSHMTYLFHNLLTNAIEYMDKPRGLVKISCTEETCFWKFSVTDNGLGIKEKYFEKIFQMFQTLAPRDEREATGIGLSIAKKIVDLYSGKIWVESQLGLGSTFFFTFPKQQELVSDNSLLQTKP